MDCVKHQHMWKQREVGIKLAAHEISKPQHYAIKNTEMKKKQLEHVCVAEERICMLVSQRILHTQRISVSMGKKSSTNGL